MKVNRGFMSVFTAMLATFTSMLLASVLLTLTTTLRRQQNMQDNNKRLGLCASYLANDEVSGYDLSESSKIVDGHSFQEIELHENGKPTFRLWRARF